MREPRIVAGLRAIATPIRRRDAFRLSSMTALGTGALWASASMPAAAVPPQKVAPTLAASMVEASLDSTSPVTMQSVAAAIRASQAVSVLGAMLPSSWVAGIGAPAIGLSAKAPPGLTLTTAVGANGEMYINRAMPLTMGGGIKIRVKRDVNLATLRFTVNIGRVRSYTTANLYAAPMPVGQWFDVVLTLGGMIGNSGPVAGDQGLISQLAIIAGPAAGTATVLEIQSVHVVRGDPRPGVCFQFDDGRLDTYTTAYPRLRAVGLPGSIAVEYNTVGRVDRCSLVQLRELYEGGWAMLGHYTGQMTTISEAGQDAVHQEMKAFLASNGFARGNKHWVWPGGSRDQAADLIARKYWATRRAISSLTTGSTVTNYAEPYDPSVRYVKKDETFENIKVRLDHVAAFGGVQTLVFHSILSNPVAIEDISITKFQQVVDYCASVGLRGYTYDEVYDPGRSELFPID